METFPHIPEDLLNALEEAFPERSADLNWSDREVWYKAGQRQVVRFLRNAFEEQNSNILNTTVTDNVPRS